MIDKDKIYAIIQSQIDFNKRIERYFAKKIKQEKHLNYAGQRFSKLMFGKSRQRTRDWTKHKEEIYDKF